MDAIECYKAALRVYGKPEFPLQWASAQAHLGVAYWELRSTDRRESLERAVEHYDAALSVLAEQGPPWEWAIAKANRDNAVACQKTGDRLANLRLAIGAYEAALRVLSPQDSPGEWDAIGRSLSTVRSDLEPEAPLSGDA